MSMISSSSAHRSNECNVIATRRGSAVPSSDTARNIVAFIEAAPNSRVVIAIDGRSGAGKTTLARQIIQTTSLAVCMIEVESFIEGWSGLVNGIQHIAQAIVVPFIERGFAVAREWNWHGECWGGERRIPQSGSAAVLLVVGCGSSSRALAHHIDASVWIDCPEEVRRSRVTSREGDPSLWWRLWSEQEDTLLTDYDSASHATWRIQRI